MVNKTSKTKKETQQTSLKTGLNTRGRTFVGLVTSDKMAKTVTVEWGRKVYVSKYERYDKKKSKVKAHNPEEISAKKGDVVKIMETRPLSKTKHFVVVEIVGEKSKKEAVKEELIQEAVKEEGRKTSSADKKEDSKEKTE